MAQQYGNGCGISVHMEGPFGGGSGTSAKLTTVDIYKEEWKGAESPYSQVVTVAGLSVNSMVNLQPSAEQLEEFHDRDLAFVTENNEGTVTVYCIGEKPDKDYTIQATLIEVTA